MPAVFRRAVAASLLESPAAASADRTLIVVQMAGGNDPLNTLVPYADGPRAVAPFPRMFIPHASGSTAEGPGRDDWSAKRAAGRLAAFRYRGLGLE